MSKSVAFCHGEVERCWELAAAFAGPKGRVATMPDVINLRIKDTDVFHSRSWGEYITTTSAEYLGQSAQGTMLLIVAHENHPMSTFKGMHKAYQRERTLKKEKRQATSGWDEAGSRISRTEFLQLESGKYGPVSIIPLEEVRDRYEYSFLSPLSAEMVYKEPLMQARLGPRWEEYVRVHEKLALEDRVKQAEFKHLDPRPPFIFQMSGADNPHYPTSRYYPDRTFQGIHGSDANEAFGRLLVITQLTNTHFSGEVGSDLVSDVGLYEESNHCRMVGLKDPESPTSIGPEPSASRLLETRWEDFLVPAKGTKAPMRRLKKLGKQWFGTTVKKGDGMDDCVCEHQVTKMQKLGSRSFLTKIGGYYGFVKYSIDEVIAVAPPGANAYTLDDANMSGENHHKIDVTFYKVDLDLSQRVLSSSEIERDTALILKYAELV